MNTKIVLENATHDADKSHHVFVLRIDHKHTVVLTYQAYNAVEKFEGEIFSDGKLNPVFYMADLGVNQNATAYIKDSKIRKERVKELYPKALKFIEALLSL